MVTAVKRFFEREFLSLKFVVAFRFALFDIRRINTKQLLLVRIACCTCFGPVVFVLLPKSNIHLLLVWVLSLGSGSGWFHSTGLTGSRRLFIRMQILGFTIVLPNKYVPEMLQKFDLRLTIHNKALKKATD